MCIRSFALSAAFFLLVLNIHPAQSAPKVVVSISPVHALATQVMAGIATPQLLLKGNVDPHSHSLKPSQALALNRADLIVVVAPTLETFLAKTLADLGRTKTILTLSAQPGMTLHKPRKSTDWGKEHDDDHEADHHDDHKKHAEHKEDHHKEDDHDDDHKKHAEHKEDHHKEDGHDDDHHDGDHHDGHDHGNLDPHLWLDPGNAKLIVTALVKALSTLDQPNAQRYSANGKQTIAKLEALDKKLRTILQSVHKTPYLVLHDGYHYFEEHYGLNALGALTVSSQHKPGARRLREIRKTIRTKNVKCVFAEPQFPNRMIATVIENTKARAGVLDLLGVSIKPGANAYSEMMVGLATSLKSCLSQ